MKHTPDERDEDQEQPLEIRALRLRMLQRALEQAEKSRNIALAILQQAAKTAPAQPRPSLDGIGPEATLTEDAKRHIAQAPACFDTPTQVAEPVKEKSGVDVPRNQAELVIRGFYG
jgi:hypothetical protein